MKTPETFIYVGGSLGLVGGYHHDARFSFVRLSDYMELEAKVRRMAMDSIHDMNYIAELQAEVERLNDAIIRGASVPDAKPEEGEQK